jgi:hypothetical protein
MTKDEANSLTGDVCVSLCTEPHFEGPFDLTQPASSFVTAMHQFVQSGGNFLAECGGIRTYESCHTEYTATKSGVPTAYPACPPGFFLTERDPNSPPGYPATALGGFDDGKKTKPRTETIYHHNPDLAFFQFDGAWNSYIGGSVSNFDLWREAGYMTRLKANSYWGVQWGTTDPSEYNTTFHSAGGKLATGGFGHNVWYVTGHDVQGFIPAERSYLNAVLIPAERDVSCGFDVDECAWGGCGGYQKRADAVPCSCTDVCDASGRCNGVQSDICPVAPAPTAPRAPSSIVRTPTAPRPPGTSGTPGGNGSPSTGSNSPSTGSDAPVVPPPVLADFPPSLSPIPYIDVNTTQGTEIVDSNDGESRYFVLVVSPDVYTMQLWVQVLNWDDTVTVEVYLRREGLPSETEYDCAFKPITQLDFDYKIEVGEPTQYCKNPLPALAGNWIVSIRTPKATGYSFEAFLEPNYARTTETTITIGAAHSMVVSLALVFILATLCMFTL